MDPVEHQIEVKAAPAEVVRALTTQEGLNGWWSADCDISERLGGEHELRFRKGDRTVVMRFRVDDMSDERVAWTCTDNGNPAWVGSTLTWEIGAAGAGSAIRFRHDGFAMGGPPYEMTVRGWLPFVESLRSYLETGVGSPA